MYPVETVDGDVELVALGVLQVEEVVLDAPNCELLESPVDADAVVDMDDEITLLELTERPEEVAFMDRPSLFSTDLRAENLFVAEDDQPEAGKDKATRQAALRENQFTPAVVFQKRADDITVRAAGLQAVILQEAGHLLHLRLAAAEQVHEISFFPPRPELFHQRLKRPLAFLERDALFPETGGLRHVQPDRPDAPLPSFDLKVIEGYLLEGLEATAKLLPGKQIGFVLEVKPSLFPCLRRRLVKGLDILISRPLQRIGVVQNDDASRR